MGDKSPLVSIIIPVYNGAKNLRQTIDSVLGQTFKDFELILVDDCSTDNSVEIIKSYGDKLRLIEHDKNAGAPAGTKNTGIKNSRGKYIAFSDHDDLWLSTKLAKQVDSLEKNSDAVANFANGFIFDDVKKIDLAARWPEIESVPSQKSILKALIKQNFILTTTGAVVRASVLKKLGGFDEKMKLADDYELWLRLAREGQLTFISEPLFRWRFHRTSLSHRVDKMLIDLVYCYKKIDGTWELDPVDKTFVQSQIGTYLIRLGNYYLEAKDYEKAKSNYQESEKYISSRSRELMRSILALSPSLASLIIKCKRRYSGWASRRQSSWMLDEVSGIN
ncbi:MAG: glycosyltransferase [Patescibacteria group bacterium]|jgi:glycosyltransferase involved in cell wall biosynthesis